MAVTFLVSCPGWHQRCNTRPRVNALIDVTAVVVKQYMGPEDRHSQQLLPVMLLHDYYCW